MKLFVCVFFYIVFLFTLPKYRCFLCGWSTKVTVEAVIGDVQLAIGKPRMLDLTGLGVPGRFQRFCRFFKPAQTLCLLQPKTIRVLNRLFPHLLKLFFAGNIRVGLNFCRRRKFTVLFHQRIHTLLFCTHNFLLCL